MICQACLGLWWLRLVAARNADHDNFGYTPHVHDEVVDIAFQKVIEASVPASPINELISKYKQVLPKETYGTCEQFACGAYRQADCLLGQCLCPDGYGTRDYEKCEKLDQPLPEWPGITQDTGGGCMIFPCNVWRGDTVCENSRCMCKSGAAALDGVCRPLVEVQEHHVRNQLLLVMKAGAAEPDNLGCPGASDQEWQEYWQMKGGTRVFDMGICRKSTQAYHASPLPLVFRQDLHEPPINNGYDDPYNLRRDLYSVLSLRQWRTWDVQVMAKEFFYSVGMQDVSDGARRLGNLIHTLGESFTASSVVRHQGHDCESFIVSQPISMDVVNWHLHWNADSIDNDRLFQCATYFAAKVIELWADARKAVSMSYHSGTFNLFLDRLIRTVLCPALPLRHEDLDKPAGGSPKEYSSDSWTFGNGKPILPRGVTAPEDADRIIASWRRSLVSYRETLDPDKRRLVPDDLQIPPREVDICESPDFTDVNEDDVLQVKNRTITPGYLLSAFRSAAEVVV